MPGLKSVRFGSGRRVSAVHNQLPERLCSPPFTTRKAAASGRKWRSISSATDSSGRGAVPNNQRNPHSAASTAPPITA